jgi:hypothetical protein
VGNPQIGRAIYLTAAEWERLALWHPGNASEQLRELLDRAGKFWPRGPASNASDRKRKP